MAFPTFFLSCHFVIFWTITCLPTGHTFALVGHHGMTAIAFRSYQTTALQLQGSSNNRDDEIARLEEKLRKLKEEKLEQDIVSGNREVPASSSSSAQSASSSSFAKNPVESQKEKLFVDRAVILSEKELVEANLIGTKSEVGGGLGGVVGIAAGVLALAGLMAFSQVPVGQENLAKYSATPARDLKSGRIDLGDLNMNLGKQQQQQQQVQSNDENQRVVEAVQEEKQDILIEQQAAETLSEQQVESSQEEKQAVVGEPAAGIMDETSEQPVASEAAEAVDEAMSEPVTTKVEIDEPAAQVVEETPVVDEAIAPVDLVVVGETTAISKTEEMVLSFEI